MHIMFVFGTLQHLQSEELLENVCGHVLKPVEKHAIIVGYFLVIRPFSEVSGVSGSFSAELDAVYRLYCREYELQLRLQQQQIELQKQQLQLQQQLQQVETLQQQQQQQQPQQQQPSPQRHASSATQVTHFLLFY